MNAQEHGDALVPKQRILRQLPEILVEREKYPLLPRGSRQRFPVIAARRVGPDPSHVVSGRSKNGHGSARKVLALG